MNAKNRIKVVSRGSRLALLQVGELAALFPELSFDVGVLLSYGDKHKEISLLDDIEEDFFTRELDRSVLDGEADVAIHSAKDLPYPLPVGLELYCLTEASDKSDSLVTRGGLRLSELPSGSRIGTSSSMRKMELLRLREDIEIVSVRGTIEERLRQVDSGRIDGLIVATCALQRLGLESRASERLPFRTHPLQGNLAVIGRSSNSELRALFARHDMRASFGRVELVGFGPGNPDLLTLAGDRSLTEADIIFHDDLLDRTFLQKYTAEKVYVGKRMGRHSHHQDEINELLYQASLSGKRTVRLKGGDPMIFGHGREEVDFLRRRFVEVSVIPGISSGIALAAYSYIPLTHRGVSSSVAFVCGHGDDLQTPSADTLVYYMGGMNVRSVATSLLQRGWSKKTPVALAYNVSLPDQQVFFSTLGELQYSFVKYPTPLLIMVGKVVDFENGRMPWKTLATGTAQPQNRAGEQIIHTPLIELKKVVMDSHDRRMLLRFDYGWIVFTSRHGVRFFFEMLDEAGVDIRRLSHVRIASVGAVTSQTLSEYHLFPDFESPTDSAEGVLEYFRTHPADDKRILLPRSNKKLSFLSDGLRSMGYQVTDITVYENRIKRDAGKVTLRDFSKILFSSPSGVEAFKEIYGEFPEGALLVAKGETTSTKLQEFV